MAMFLKFIYDNQEEYLSRIFFLIIFFNWPEVVLAAPPPLVGSFPGGLPHVLVSRPGEPGTPGPRVLLPLSVLTLMVPHFDIPGTQW